MSNSTIEGYLSNENLKIDNYKEENMTPGQKKYREEMRKLQKQGLVAEDEGPRRNKVDVKPILRVVVLLVLVYSIINFALPKIDLQTNTNTGINADLLSMESVLPKLSNGAVLTDRGRVSNYLQKTKHANNKIKDINNKWNNHIRSVEDYRAAEILDDLNELRGFIDDLQTNESLFLNLQYAYNEILFIYEELLMNINNYFQDSSSMVDRLNQLQVDIHNEVISLLEEHHMDYEILSDGDIRYWY